jgi:hypothetical protein
MDDTEIASAPVTTRRRGMFTEVDPIQIGDLGKFEAFPVNKTLTSDCF